MHKNRSKRTSKKLKGGLLGRLTSLAMGQGVSAQTYCCDAKTSSGDVLGGDNVGTNCTPSYTGQCNIGYGIGQNYKFRCFNPQTKEYRATIEESSDLRNNGERCEYVSGTLAKVAKVGVGAAKTTGSILVTGLGGLTRIGGKSRRRTHRKSYKKHSRKSRK